MSLETVKEYLSAWERDKDILIFDSSSATVALAAQVLNTKPERIAKSLAFYSENEAIVIVVAGDAKVDNKKFKSTFGFKAKMLSVDDTFNFTNHEIGGVCPFALPQNVKVHLDISLKRFETVFPACGSSNSAIKLTIPELEQYSKFVDWVDVCKGWETE